MYEMDIITFPGNLFTTCGLSIILHDVISLQYAKLYFPMLEIDWVSVYVNLPV